MEKSEVSGVQVAGSQKGGQQAEDRLQAHAHEAHCGHEGEACCGHGEKPGHGHGA